MNIKRNGFSIIELLIIIAIIGVLSSIGIQLVNEGFSSIKFESEQEIAIQNARKGIEIAIKEIREADSSAQGDYALALLEDNQFIFYSDIDDDGKTEKIKYYLDSNYLKRSEIQPGQNNDYSGEEEVAILTNYLNNQDLPIFSYYDENNNDTKIVKEVRLIKVKLLINVNPQIAPQDYYLESDVQLRNLKSNFDVE